jgi:hypothetical protein
VRVLESSVRNNSRWLRRAAIAGAGLTTILAALAPGAVGASAASPIRARQARTITLNDTGRLHETAHHGFRLDEQGTASGTIKGSIYIHLDITSTNHVTAEVSIYPSNGSLTGQGSANYRSEGGEATFSGTLAISRGTGAYAGAHASALSFSGTIQRSNDATTVHVSGNLST